MLLQPPVDHPQEFHRHRYDRAQRPMYPKTIPRVGPVLVLFWDPGSADPLVREKERRITLSPGPECSAALQE